MNIKKLLLPVALSIVALFTGNSKAEAQASGYSFAQSTGTYTSLNRDAILSSGSGMDDATFSITIPSFTYNGVAYTQVYASENGYISFASTNPGTSTRSFLNTAGGITSGGVSGFSHNLGGITSTDTSELSWKTFGNITTIQWRFMSDYVSTDQNYNFQIKLNHTNNVVSIVYGTMTAISIGSSAGQVGIRISIAEQPRQVGLPLLPERLIPIPQLLDMVIPS